MMFPRMTATRRGSLASALLLMWLGCGGSSSETPWPAEPIDLEPGPAGEGLQRGNVLDTRKLPDNYTKKAKAAAGTSDTEDPESLEIAEPDPTDPDAPAPIPDDLESEPESEE
jgi:hypothetical protein